jgi:hypothetical protein
MDRILNIIANILSGLMLLFLGALALVAAWYIVWYRAILISLLGLASVGISLAYFSEAWYWIKKGK